jgi:hypothetical protein
MSYSINSSPVKGRWPIISKPINSSPEKGRWPKAGGVGILLFNHPVLRTPLLEIRRGVFLLRLIFSIF